ncbi:hypothetical protein HaLaN_16258 [Haematococcus lacustris]|uniref:Uncharacterized protein n=1 Tax=Haematococcus lacustris TaxID=44745 RepID=A0A699ZK18_HAELA|nr:hypothetical protein HaLaN_16258 [Haematococcus lacustris]
MGLLPLWAGCWSSNKRCAGCAGGVLHCGGVCWGLPCDGGSVAASCLCLPRDRTAMAALSSELTPGHTVDESLGVTGQWPCPQRTANKPTPSRATPPCRHKE